MEDEYELVPMNPIRRLERRMEKMEKTGGGDTSRELIEIVKANQTVIDEMVKMNAEMMTRLTELLSSVNTMTQKMNDFMGRLEVTSDDSSPDSSASDSKYEERIAKLEKRINSLLVSSMQKRPPMRGI